MGLLRHERDLHRCDQRPLPNAKVVLDRFHIAKALNDAVDEVRKQQWRNATGAERKALKGVRWLLFKHPSKRTADDKRILESLRTGNRRILRACVLKDEFDHFWSYKAPWAARRFPKRWCTSALRSRLEPLHKFVRTLKGHADDVITFVESGGLTNAIAEGINRIIKQQRRLFPHCPQARRRRALFWVLLYPGSPFGVAPAYTATGPLCATVPQPSPLKPPSSRPARLRTLFNSLPRFAYCRFQQKLRSVAA